jgi:nucleotide-binding universal stress UspA family protein
MQVPEPQARESEALEATVAAASKILDRILVAIDYSMDSHRALGVALELERLHGSIIRVFHAAESTGSDDWLAGIGSPSVGGDWVEESRHRLHRFLDNVAPGSSSRIEIAARVGNPIETIRREIRDWSPTLLIAAAHVHAIIVRSPAEQLVRDIKVPVLVLPREDNPAGYLDKIWHG